MSLDLTITPGALVLTNYRLFPSNPRDPKLYNYLLNWLCLKRALDGVRPGLKALDDAVKVLCLALPKEKAKGEGVHPTRAMAKHILQIAANQGRQDELRARIKAVLPRLV